MRSRVMMRGTKEGKNMGESEEDKFTWVVPEIEARVDGNSK